MAAMVTAREESGRLYTHQTENVCADPPSKPASQDRLARLGPGETDSAAAAWGLVPAARAEKRGEELVETSQRSRYLTEQKVRGASIEVLHLYIGGGAERRHRLVQVDRGDFSKREKQETAHVIMMHRLKKEESC